jgi:ubiquinone/menaquinone biosynthesis C-methylase UbiE
VIVLPSIKSTAERVVPEKGLNDEKYCGHLIFYEFASKYVKSKAVLDDGCGTGYGTHFLLNSEPSITIGVDRSFEAISYAAEKYCKSGLHYLVNDCGKLPFVGKTFDTVVSSQVIEHIADYENYLSEIVRVLKKSGILLIGTPNKKSFNPRGPPMPFHFKEFFAEEFVLLLQKFFENVEIFGQYNLKTSRRKSSRQSLIKLGQSRFLLWLSPSSRVKVGRRLASILRLNESYSLKDFRIEKFEASTSMNIICICSIKKATL